MKKRIVVFALVCVLLFVPTVTAFAANPELIYDSSYDADTNTVTVSVGIKNAEGFEGGDLMFAFDSDMFEFVSAEPEEVDGAIISSGKSVYEEGACTCSLIFSEKCDKSQLDSDGRLNVCVFKFHPTSEDYNYDSFALWATSYFIDGDNDIKNSIEIVGNKSSATGHVEAVTLGSTQKNNEGGANGAEANANANAEAGDNNKTGDKASVSTLSSRWYLYVLAAVVAVGAIVGIAFIAAKNEHGEDENKNDASDDEKEQKGSEKTENSDIPEDKTKTNN